MIEFRVPSFTFRAKTRNPKTEAPNWQVQTRTMGHEELVTLLLSCIVLLLVAACGHKGDPRAPEQALPQTIKDLRAETDGRGIVLTWSRPTRYVDRKQLRDLAGFVIFRKELAKACPDCPSAYRERTTVNVEDHEKFAKKKQFRFIDQELKPQTIYRYRVFSQLTDGSLSEPSNEVEVSWES